VAWREASQIAVREVEAVKASYRRNQCGAYAIPRCVQGERDTAIKAASESDAKIQIISGRESRKNLELYKH